MAGYTYATLLTAIEDELQSTETTFVTHIPDFVKAAESDIYQSVQIPDLRKNSTTTLTSSNAYLSLPSDFLSAYSLTVTDSSVQYHLLNKEVDFIREAYPNATTTGRPRFYSLFDDDTFLVAPTPDSGYTVELHYYYRPSSIVDDSTSWIGTNAPNALLYGSLIHAYIFLKGDQDILQYYRGEFTRAVANLQVICEGRARKDTYRKENKKIEV